MGFWTLQPTSTSLPYARRVASYQSQTDKPDGSLSKLLYTIWSLPSSSLFCRRRERPCIITALWWDRHGRALRTHVRYVPSQSQQPMLASWRSAIQTVNRRAALCVNIMMQRPGADAAACTWLARPGAGAGPFLPPAPLYSSGLFFSPRLAWELRGRLAGDRAKARSLGWWGGQGSPFARCFAFAFAFGLVPLDPGPGLRTVSASASQPSDRVFLSSFWFPSHPSPLQSPAGWMDPFDNAQKWNLINRWAGVTLINIYLIVWLCLLLLIWLAFYSWLDNDERTCMCLALTI